MPKVIYYIVIDGQMYINPVGNVPDENICYIIDITV